MLPSALIKDSSQGISYKGEKGYKSYKSGKSIDKMLSSGNETDITYINSGIRVYLHWVCRRLTCVIIQRNLHLSVDILAAKVSCLRGSQYLQMHN